ncbi:ABC transporter substrate-binding protein, partial [Streptomyces sp. NPDC002920]
MRTRPYRAAETAAAALLLLLSAACGSRLPESDFERRAPPRCPRPARPSAAPGSG